LRGS
jgi:hypothetical protein